MPRYFFDVHDRDGLYVDDVGIELANMEAARREARRALSDMVRDALREDKGLGVSVKIRDGSEGPVLITVTLSTAEPPEVH